MKELERPSIYPQGHHVPVARPALLEEVEERVLREEGDIVAELKKHQLEGLYNLSFLLLCFSLLYNAVRNVREKGFLVDVRVLWCRGMVQDVVFAVGVYAGTVALARMVYALVRDMMRERRPGRGPLFPSEIRTAVYVAIQVAVYVGGAAAVISAQLSPIVGSVVCGTIVTLSLKMHSFYATNILLWSEWQSTVSRKPAGQTELTPPAPSSPVSSTTSPSATSSSETLKSSDTATTAISIQSMQAFWQRLVRPSRSESASRAAQRGYPSCVTLPNYLYFVLAAPTLVYETRYPRSPRIRVRYVAWHLSQVAVCALVMFCVIMQFMLPALRSSSGSFVFDMMKLALPSIIAWLLGFYGFFHAFLNVVAELTRFADRRFYLDWWNSTSLDTFWNTWNLSVHEWCLRHVFVESQQRYHVSRAEAGFATFLLSAVLHEYIFAIAFRAIRPAMLVGMMLQIPLIYVTRHLSYPGRRRGNLLVWLNLFVGHPFIEILYVRQYLAKHDTLFSCS